MSDRKFYRLSDMDDDVIGSLIGFHTAMVVVLFSDR